MTLDLDPRVSGPRVTVWREEVLPGSETFIANQVRAMRSWTPALAGVRACPNPLGTPPEFVVDDGARSFGARANRWLYWRHGTSPRLHRQLRDSRLVHAHFGTDGARVLRAARVARRPLVVTFHGYDATMAPAQLGVDYRPLFRQAAGLICVSEFLRQRLISAGAPAERTVVLHIGTPIPADIPPGRERQRRLLFVGRLVEKKGCIDLLSALSGMPTPIPLDVIGDGPLRAELERRAQELRLPVRFLGARSPADVAEAMAASTALCVPSKTASNGDQEGLPMVLLEAAARRLPIVGYASAGVPEAIAHGETGLLAPEGDVAGLARALGTVLSDRELATRLGAAGRTRTEALFDVTRCTARLERFYDAVTKRG